MKKLFLFAALAVASWLGAVDTALLKYLPAKSAGFGLVDVARLAKHPEIKAALEDPESVEAFKTLGIKHQDVLEIAGYYVDDDLKGAVVRIADGGALKAQLDASPMLKSGENSVVIAAMEFNGIRAYRCSLEGKNEAIFASFVAADVLAFADSETELEAYLKSPKLDGSQAYPHAAKVALWGVWNNPDVKKDSKDGQLLSVEATLDLVGEEQQDVVIAAILNCDRSEYASQLGMMIPGYAQMGAAMAFQKKPELGSELLGNFRCNVKDFEVHLSLFLPKELLDKLETFITDNNVVAEPDPVPRDINAK